MTNRFKDLDLIWAVNGEVKDPDLDTTAHGYVKDKYAKGWVVEKEPHPWQNFLQQITDLKLNIFASETYPEYEIGITYPLGSLFKSNGVVYRATANGATPTSNSVKVLSQTADDIATSVANLTNSLTSHMSKVNPHNDTIEAIGGYSSDAIDYKLTDNTNPNTLAYHVARTGATVHGETPAQLGTLPTSGGTFTGQVTFLDKLLFGNKSIIGSVVTAYSTNSNDVIATIDHVVDEVNYETVRKSASQLFRLPTPYKMLTFNIGASPDTMHPAYFAYGDIVTDSNGWVPMSGVQLDGFSTGNKVTAVIYFTDTSGVAQINVKDITDNNTDLKILVGVLASKVATVQSIVYYPPLTAYQKNNFKAPI